MSSAPPDDFHLHAINTRLSSIRPPAETRPAAPLRGRLTAWGARLARRSEGGGPVEAASIQETTNQKNLLLLVALRWVAVVGQVTTIAVTGLVFQIGLPIQAMACVLLALAAANGVSFYRAVNGAAISNGELFVQILIDVGALTLQLYLTGGVTNPFVWLFLIQVILGAVLLQPVLSWSLVVVTTLCFVLLAFHYRDIGLAGHGVYPPPGQAMLLNLRRWGMLIAFTLAAALQVLFVTRINRNLRQRDNRVAELRQQTAEEAHIVRMGLLASGAAHELGSPLATLSVIMNDWGRMPALTANKELGGELGEMQTALARCKEIVSRMLLAVGETRAEGAERTTLVQFFDAIVDDWRASRAPARVDYLNQIRADAEIVSDAMIKQALLNVFDNALEASPAWVGIEVAVRAHQVVVKVHDKGPGFAPEVLARFGKPYVSTKARPGRGLGLYLVTNVLRKLGGAVVGLNNPEGGATVTVRFPIDVLSLGAPDAAV
jgi:two-component system sensor histidine kinase RegB